MARINPALFIRSGDFLFSRANTQELVGACVIARQSKLNVMLSDKILRFRFADGAMKPWLLGFLRTRNGRAQIEALASGNQASMRNIGQERIGQIRVPLAPRIPAPTHPANGSLSVPAAKSRRIRHPFAGRRDRVSAPFRRKAALAGPIPQPDPPVPANRSPCPRIRAPLIPYPGPLHPGIGCRIAAKAMKSLE